MATTQEQEQEQEQVIMTLKLLIDKNTERVLFAEAGKDVIDFLFSLLAFPLGSIVNLLTTENHLKMMGCIAIANLHNSVQILDKSYMLPNINKTTTLLSPTSTFSTVVSNNTLFLTSSASNPQKKYYRCNSNSHTNCRSYLSEANDTRCPSCNSTMSTQMLLVMNTPQPVNSGGGGEGAAGVGFVKGVVTYSVMDDLTVMPMSTISSIMLLNKFNIKDVGSLEERIVELGLEEGLELLKSSLHSKTVLTDVFVQTKGKKTKAENIVD